LKEHQKKRVIDSRKTAQAIAPQEQPGRWKAQVENFPEEPTQGKKDTGTENLTATPRLAPRTSAPCIQELCKQNCNSALNLNAPHQRGPKAWHQLCSATSAFRPLYDARMASVFSALIAGWNFDPMKLRKLGGGKFSMSYLSMLDSLLSYSLLHC